MMTRTGGKGATLFYATILEVYPDDPREEVWPRIVEVFQKWVLRKERRRAPHAGTRSTSWNLDIRSQLTWRAGMLTSAYTAALLRSQIGSSLESLANTSRAHGNRNVDGNILHQLTTDQATWTDDEPNTLGHPSGAPRLSQAFAIGGFNAQGASSSLKTITTGETPIPRLWAMDYTEKDSEHWWRAWHTNVGITRSDIGTYRVAIQILFSVDPTYLRADVKAPPRNVPNCVRDLLALEGIACIAGEDPLTGTALRVGQSSKGQPYPFEQFYDDLTKPIRTIPLVTVSSNANGRFPVDPDDLAQKLTGVASVVAIDRSDPDLDMAIERVFFTPDTRNYRYRPNRGLVKVYFPSLNMDNPRDYRRHYQFPPDWSDQSAAALSTQMASDIIASAARSFAYPAGVVSSCADVEATVANERRDELANRYREYRRRERPEERARLKAQYDAALDELTKARKGEQERAGELSRARDLLEEALEDISQKNKEIDELNEYVALLEEDANVAADANQSLNREVGNLTQENAQYQWQIQGLKDQLARQAGASGAPSLSPDDLKTLPTSVEEALVLAGKFFPARLVVHPDALRSAREHDSGDCAEAWQILYAIATTLYCLCFEEGLADGGTLEDHFHRKTGFALALRESKATKDNSTLMRSRKIIYEGETVDITPHVKGKSGRRDEPLRVHFYLDHDRHKIVIGHCGAHLETAGTRRKGLK